MRKYLCPFFLYLCVSATLSAQEQLSIEAALTSALANNFDIAIAKQEYIAAQSTIFYGNANEQPIYTLTASENGQLNSVNQKFLNGSEIARLGVPAHALNMQFGVAYPVLNKKRIYATKERIRTQSTIANHRQNAQIQTTAAQVIVRYYDIVRQQKLMQLLQRTIAVSEKRLDLIKVRQSVGVANNTDLYLAELDLNSRKQDYEQQALTIKQLKVELNTLLSREKSLDFIVSDSIILNTTLQYAALLAAAKNNPDVLMAGDQIKVMEWMEKEMHTQRLPTTRVVGGVSGSLSNTTAGFLLQNISYGPFIGVNVSVPLFNQKVFNKQEETLAMQRKSREIQLMSLQNTIEGSMLRTWQAWQTNSSRTITEAANMLIAQQYLALIEQRFALNQSNAIEFREAQRSYEDAAYRLTSVQFAAKLAETELLRLAAQLVK
jgi:outer membrane protein